MAQKSTTGAYGLGRRKEAIAQVILMGTEKERTVNGIDFATYFPTVSMQNVVLNPLGVVGQEKVSGFKAKVSGGGKQSQAGALRLAIARAIVARDESFRKQLKDAGTLTRDARAKERKKFGLKRARRAPQFSKR